MKGLILCAGKGTRLQPYSFSQPKTMLPVANKPVLEYCIENLLRQGIEEIGIVINPGQEVIRQKIGNGERFKARIQYIIQREQKGISHAIKQAQEFIGNHPFVLLLGDNLIAEDLKTLISSYRKDQSEGAIMLAPVEKPQDFGVAEIKGNEIVSLQEKPMQPKSNLAVIGAYLFESIIFKAIHEISPSPRGEYEITDAIQWLMNQGYKISYTITHDLYSDIGTVPRWMDANQWMMKKHVGEQVILGRETVVENCIFQGPVMIGENCILKNAEIGPFVAVENDCTIENGKIDMSILLEKSTISQFHSISNSIIGREAYLKGWHGPVFNHLKL
ncbi:MAG TPA: glucose-1-phosphate thymidylyltransferase, partial [Bacillota bacterium]|nr:glucose-1-phosphate thymidylyltransferase [Bacillota bacterium]